MQFQGVPVSRAPRMGFVFMCVGLYARPAAMQGRSVSSCQSLVASSEQCLLLLMLQEAGHRALLVDSGALACI